ncbi:MAG: ArgE/DapE family deacylase [Actinobacteria bacterium]|nr:ArgE/DapE family deacylase [Actinomycetota bacterium]
MIGRCRERAAREVSGVLEKLISYDTTICTAAEAARDDPRHQDFVAGYLRDIGAEVELFEPSVEEVADHPLYLQGQSFALRPSLWARLRGRGDGRSLLFNGHYDTVPADPIAEWTSDPWTAEVRAGRIYGRGACDMKGGIAAALAAAAALAQEGVSLAGDLNVNVVPFEEVNGMGTIATVRRGFRADAAVCCEPTELEMVVACRGILIGTVEVEGRAAHAEIGQPHPEDGGGVSAIEKLIDLLVELRRLDREWSQRSDKQHPLLSTPILLPTVIDGGEFASSWPGRAEATLNVCYLPGEVDGDGHGGRVRAEIESLIATAASLDPWLAERPPTVRWNCDFPPVELSADEPIVAAASAALEAAGSADSELVGLDSWADHVTLSRAGIPAICLGPGSIHQAHGVDEYVDLHQLEAAARAYVELAVRWCGVGIGG